jgi:hypothetical protein
MTSLADQQIEAFVDNLYREMDDLTQRQVERIATRFQKKLQDANQSFFTILSQKIVDVLDYTELGIEPYTPPEWRLLTPKYLRWKLRSKMSPKFFKARGDLDGELKALDAIGVLGAPEVTVFAGATVGSKDVYQVVGKDGRVRYRNRRTGRFASAADFARRIPRSISTNAFPNLKLDGVNLNARDGSVEHAVVGPYQRVLHKLAGRARQHPEGVRRPVIGAYLQWWFDNRIRRVIEGAA